MSRVYLLIARYLSPNLCRLPTVRRALDGGAQSGTAGPQTVGQR